MLKSNETFYSAHPMRSLPEKISSLYNEDPRSVIKYGADKQAADEKNLQRRAKKLMKRKREGRTLVMLKRWQTEMGDLMFQAESDFKRRVDESAPPTSPAPELSSQHSDGPSFGSVNRDDNDDDQGSSLAITGSSQAAQKTDDGASLRLHSPSTTLSRSSAGEDLSQEDYKLWLTEAKLFTSQARQFLSPHRERIDEDKDTDIKSSSSSRGEEEEHRAIAAVKPPYRETTIEGEPNEFARQSAIDPETTLPVTRGAGTFQSISFNNNSAASAFSTSGNTVMSLDKLRNHKLFAKKSLLQTRVFPPTVVTSTEETLVARKGASDRSDDPDRNFQPAQDESLSIHSRKKTHPPQLLYKMSFPVLPTQYEMEKFERENTDLRRRILVKRGKLPPHALAAARDFEPPYALGETPLNPRSGGKVEPHFYGIRTQDSPMRLPSNHLSFWQNNAKFAPTSVEIGLGVMSFQLPEEKMTEEIKDEQSVDYFQNVGNYVAAKNELATKSGSEEEQTTPFSPFASSKVAAPTLKPEIYGEASEILEDVLASNIGKGQYHDTTASHLAAPADAHSMLPQVQPFGFSTDKPRMRALSMTDALKFQGDISPRTKLHHFQMFPFSTEAHEATFIIQRFWERHVRRRLWAATLVQSHYRKLRAFREFQEYVQLVRKAIKAIEAGAEAWLTRAHLSRDSSLANRIVTDECIKDFVEIWLEEDRQDQFCKNAMISLVYRYRWKRRMKKRRKRRKELEVICSIRCQRGARYFLVARRMKRWLHAHMVLKRSFRAYFFRAYKKQLRKIMNCWRSYWLRHHVKLIQRIHRGRMGRKRASMVRVQWATREGIRGVGELEAARTMLSEVGHEMETHLKTKEGLKELRTRSKLCKKLYRENYRKAKSELTSKNWEDKLAMRMRAWLSMFEIPEDADNMSTDGFIDIESIRIALKDLLLGESNLMHGEEIDGMIRELDVFQMGHINCDLMVAFVTELIGKKREKEREAMSFAQRLRQDAVCWGKGLKVRATTGTYIKAAKRSLLEQERKRYYLKTIEAFRTSGEADCEPKASCKVCLKAFPYWTISAQKHVQSGGCCLRPSFSL